MKKMISILWIMGLSMTACDSANTDNAATDDRDTAGMTSGASSNTLPNNPDTGNTMQGTDTGTGSGSAADSAMAR